MTEINIKIKLTDELKTMLDTFCYELGKTAVEFIEFKVGNQLHQIVKGAIIDDFEKQVIDGKIFEVTVESAGGDNENG